MNNVIVAVATFALGAISTAVIAKKTHQKTIKALLETHKIEDTKTFMAAHSSGYIAGERAAVIDYAPGKYDELIEAQEKRP